VRQACIAAANLNDPRRRVSLDVDLHALVLIGTVLEMHRNPVAELEHDEAVIRNRAPCDLHVHDIKEAWLRPPAFFPMRDEPAVTKEIYRGLDRESDGTERELEIELTYPQLRGERPDDRGKVKLFGYPVHSCSVQRVDYSNGPAY
jgi:hypothetical protein